ncbi:uncharacterized protein LOC127080423 [Lathyrus oleraceus]|uniref:uncharacterized protein LOC127080423 n=1 Tax=Pisum sativum TaxID=3888 RepID=UPI0021CE3837|nr:uncharacterized protein LOC127080423 [Pisum sativum]
MKNNKIEEENKDREILDVFRKVTVNIPLLNIIKKVPKYAKFKKDLCTHKRRLTGNERVNLGRNVLALIQPNTSPTNSALTQDMPQKCKDLGNFAILCTIGDSKFKNRMLDLGADISVIPTSMYNNLDVGPLQHTCLIVQLANISNARPAGVVEDVLVQVNDLIFLANFCILDMYGETNSNKSPIILGRAFMKTAKTKVDVDDGTMSMEFGDVVAKFNIFDAMKHPLEEHSFFQINFISQVVDETYFDLFSANFPTFYDFDDIYSCDDYTNTKLCSVYAEIDVALQGDNVNEAVYIDEALDISTAPNIPSIEQPPSLEPKPLPEDLYYSLKLQLEQEHKKRIR